MWTYVYQVESKLTVLFHMGMPLHVRVAIIVSKTMCLEHGLLCFYSSFNNVVACIEGVCHVIMHALLSSAPSRGWLLLYKTTL